MTPEAQNIEWKRSWRDEYLAWICGFANAQGGVIEIGKNDRGEVVGVRNVLSLLEDIPNKVRSLLGIVVDVNLKSDDGGLEYIEIVVKPHTNPISYRGRFHYRSGSTKQVLEGAGLTRFLLERYGRTWDDVPLPGVGFRSLDSRTFDDFRRRGAESRRMPRSILDESDESVIEKLRLREAGFLKRAAVLLFHPEPHRFITEAYLKIGYLRGSEVLFQDVIQGDLFTQVDRTLDLLYTKYTRALISYDDIYRVETFPVPRDAMREAVINAVIHRDYVTPASIQIRVYDDRISIWNAAHLESGWGVERLLRQPVSHPRNPHLAYAFFRAGLIEAWGRGIRRIIEECERAGNPAPVWKPAPEGTGMRVRFPFSDAWQAADREAREGPQVPATGKTSPSETTQKPRSATHKTTPDTTQETAHKTTQESAAGRILDCLRAEPSLTRSLLAERVGLTADGVKYHLKKLKAEGLIRRVGSRKHGHWEVLGETEATATSARAGKTNGTASPSETTQKPRSATHKATPDTTQETAHKATQESAAGRILDCLRAEPSLTRSLLAERVGLTADGVKYHLKKLKAEGLIRRAGSRKHGHWEVLGDEEPSP